MNHTLTLLIAALALHGTAIAQSPPAAVKPPAAPAKAPAAPQPVRDDDREPTGDEELALAALEGLMAQPGDRALPIIKKVLAGPQSTLVK
jgi:hypothetical protein